MLLRIGFFGNALLGHLVTTCGSIAIPPDDEVIRGWNIGIGRCLQISIRFKLYLSNNCVEENAYISVFLYTRSTSCPVSECIDSVVFFFEMKLSPTCEICPTIGHCDLTTGTASVFDHQKPPQPHPARTLRLIRVASCT